MALFSRRATIKDLVVPKEEQARFDLAEYAKMSPEDILPDNCHVVLPTAAEIKERLHLGKEEVFFIDSFGELRNGPLFVHDRTGRIVEKADVEKKQLPDSFKKCLMEMDFCHFVSPDIMYMHLASSIQELHYMEAVLSDIVEDLPSVRKEDAVPGAFVACTLQLDDERTTWVRAVVRQVLPGSQYIKLILVDYGSEITQNYSILRPLPPFFQTIPGFAIRIHLDSGFVVPSTSKYWTSASANSMGKFLRHWEHKKPLYFVWRPETARTIPLAYFGQRTVFDSAIPGWKACDVSVSTTSTEATVTKMRDHPLLRSLFKSLGLDIGYELSPWEEDNNELRFESMGEVLFRTGFCNRILEARTGREQHEAITEATIEPEYVKKQKLFGGNETHFESWGTIEAVTPKEKE